MSIDTRLRVGLRSETELIEQSRPVDVVDTWAEVLGRSERDTRRRRTRMLVAVAAVVAVAAIVVGLTPRAADHLEPAPPDPPPTQSDDTRPTGSPVEGKWVAGPVPVQRVLDHLAEEGYGDVARDVVRGLRPDLVDVKPDQTIEFRVILRADQLVAGVSVDGDTVSDVDFQSYEVRGDRVAFIQQGTGCETLLGWKVSDDGSLALDIRDSECPPVAGAPDAAYAAALYTTIPFRPAT